MAPKYYFVFAPKRAEPIVTWVTPCSSRMVRFAGTSTRRYTIGLIPSSQDFNLNDPVGVGCGHDAPAISHVAG